MKGTLYCVSVGPGDPELMTLKAVRIIRQCQIIALSADGRAAGLMEGKDTREERMKCVAYAIAWGAVPQLDEKEILPLSMPMTKDRQSLEQSHRAAASSIERFLKEGKDVAYLTLGDTSVYASCMYPAAILKKDGWPVQMVSGVTSFCAASARLGEALVSGSEQLHILPSSYEVEKALDLPGVKVLMKSGKKLETVKELLKARGDEVTAVERCGMEGERIFHSLEELPPDAGYYTTLIVRKAPLD
mgnify:FL=1